VIRFGILGAGRIGKVHARTIADSGKAKVAFVADAIAEAASSLAGSVGAEVSSVDEVIASDVDAILIATPTDTHADLIEQAGRGPRSGAVARGRSGRMGRCTATDRDVNAVATAGGDAPAAPHHCGFRGSAAVLGSSDYRLILGPVWHTASSTGYSTLSLPLPPCRARP